MKADKAEKKSTKGKKEVAGPSAAADKKKQVKKKGKEEPDKKEKEKKVFDLPGQRYEAPEERDPLRIFYETLYQQRPDSEMAEVWMMEHGLLSQEDAKVALSRKQKRAEQMRKGGPGMGALTQRSPPPANKKKTPVAVSSNGKVKLKKRADDEDDDFEGSKKKKVKRRMRLPLCQLLWLEEMFLKES
ncbi:hypothetical protein CBR_g36457 [Chara braunii]|uniref:Uncharacterized protein n=1 Tax=Chara braunii TaxID=69332 RepID=A0A388LKS6_CHABU|nr:hypothetical protein CBR_g36457 [Chara braunii]|eukprot:GBG82930.1 hypothetical protein CBR_g36457 [Chara braunii]